MGLSAQTTSAIDAAVSWDNGREYFFHGDQYSRFNPSRSQVDSGYPLTTNNRTWPGLPWAQVDAVVNYGNGVAYFFKGSEYVAYDIEADRALANYPRNTRNGWDIPFATLAAAAYDRDRTIILFSGDQYALYDIETESLYPNYPQDISQLNLPRGFDTIDGAMYEQGVIHLFKGERYLTLELPYFFLATSQGLSSRDAWPGLEFPAQGIEQEPINRPVDPPQVGFSVEEYKVDLGTLPVVVDNTVLSWAQMTGLPNGNLVIAYQNSNDVVLRFLDQSMSLQGRPVVLNDYWLSEITTDHQGNLLLALGRDVNNTYITGYPNALYLMKLNPSGREIFNTYIFGGTGHGPGKSWFDGRSEARLAMNGENYGVYFEVQKNWAEPGQAEDIHNGDMFAVVESNGQLNQDSIHFWTASHSSTVQVNSAPSGEYFTMTIGDAYPYGLQFYNRDRDTQWLLWPPAEDYIPYEEVNSTNAAGILSAMVPWNDGFAAFMGTTESPNIGWNTKVDVMFMATDPEGNVERKVWLTRTPIEDDSVITAVPIDGGYLVAWGKGNDYDDNWKTGPVTLAIIDNDGRFIQGPQQFELPFGSYARFTKTPDGRVFWTDSPRNGSAELNIYEVLF